MTPRDTLIFAIREALRSVPKGFLRNLASKQLPRDSDATGNLVAEQVLQHLERAGWRIEPGPGVRGHSSPPSSAAPTQHPEPVSQRSRPPSASS